jgi:hypothetical protein
MGALLDIAIENYQREIIELQTAASKAQSKEELEKELGDNLLACLSCDTGQDPPGGKKKKAQGKKNTQISRSADFTAAKWDNFNKNIGAFDLGQGAKGELINYAAKSSPEINNLKYVKGIKVLGYSTFIGSTLITGGLTINYYLNGGTNPSVGIKAGVDIIMGSIGFLGPIGFGVSATYFILDVSGVFQGWGDPLLTPKK